MKECFKEGSSREGAEPEKFTIPLIIPENVARMAVHLTEYYQSRRMAYEKVSIVLLVPWCIILTVHGLGCYVIYSV